MTNLFVAIYIKFFFLMTPFFLMSTFLSMTSDIQIKERKRIALKVTFAVIVISLILFLIGNYIFSLFGITLNSFRIGTGILLFLSAISLVQGADKVQSRETQADISVVPLAIPVTVGPATTGALLVMGVELLGIWEKAVGIVALISAIVSVGILLYLSGEIERIIKKQGVSILSKVTGLILSALAAQMIMAGVTSFVTTIK